MWQLGPFGSDPSTRVNEQPSACFSANFEQDRWRRGRYVTPRGRPGCARARAVLRNYKKNGTAFWNDLIVLHLGDAASSGVSGYDLAFLREARGPADAEDARLSEAFGLKRRLAPFTGELAEASVLAH